MKNSFTVDPEGKTARIDLQGGMQTVIDFADFSFADSIDGKWQRQYAVTSDTWYAWHLVGKRDSRRKVYLHRLIMGEPKGMEVDHLDHDGLNNRRTNLRSCTRGENQRNRAKARKGSRSGVAGIHWNSRERKPWGVRLMVNGVIWRFGYHSTIKEAQRALEAGRAGKVFQRFLATGKLEE